MSHSVQVMCPPAAAAGFRLAGLRPIVAQNSVEAGERLGALLADPSVGVVLIDERLHEGLPDSLRRDLLRHPLPMIVPVPSPAWVSRAEGPEAFIAELLRQAIGYRVRLT